MSVAVSQNASITTDPINEIDLFCYEPMPTEEMLEKNNITDPNARTVNAIDWGDRKKN